MEIIWKLQDETRRIFRNKEREYLKDKTNGAQTDIENTRHL
jgi:hypothetical protein